MLRHFRERVALLIAPSLKPPRPMAYGYVTTSGAAGWSAYLRDDPTFRKPLSKEGH